MNYGNRRATLLINPSARGSHKFDTGAALGRLREGGVTPRLVITHSTEQAVAAVREAIADCVEFVFVVGGDGSARVVAGELAGSETALATLRGGTANVWAHEIGIPSGVAGIDAHLTGQIVNVDLCYRGDDPFLLMAGIGWDAAVAGRVHEGGKRWLGPGAYVLAGARSVGGIRATEMTISIDGEPRTGAITQVVLGNTRLYGNVARLTPNATATDGLMDYVVVAPTSLREGLEAAARLAAPRLGDGRSIWRGTAATFAVETPGVPVQLDGDVCGVTPAEFRVAPGVLRVSVPAGPLPPVLGG